MVYDNDLERPGGRAPNNDQLAKLESKGGEVIKAFLVFWRVKGRGTLRLARLMLALQNIQTKHNQVY